MVAQVIVDIASSEVDKIFDYLVPEGLVVSCGQRVMVPFGKRQIEGYVVGLSDNSTVDPKKLRSILSTLDPKPLILPELMDLAKFMKSYYHLRYVDIFRLLVPSMIRSGKIKELIVKYVRLQQNEEEVAHYVSSLRKNATSCIRAIQYLQNVGTARISVMNKTFGNTAIKKLVHDGVLIEYEEKQNRLAYNQSTNSKPVTLTPTQQDVVDFITKNQGVILLHGVTGSGKTEVYMNAIKKVLEQGKNAIMLVPEISLTPQVVRNFEAKFGTNIAVLHSGLGSSERFDEWNRIYQGQARVVVGARSAIFAPITNLGMVVIDEEHDGSYYSESNPRYYTHEVAKFRCAYDHCPLVLGSATPSIESYHQAMEGKYQLVTMPQRVNQKPLPNIEIVDMCKEFRAGNHSIFSGTFLERLKTSLQKKEQVMIFINRRGYSSYIMCRACGYIPKCPNCDVSLCYHEQEKQLKCHYCGAKFYALTACPECGNKDLKYGGVGTQRAQKELQEAFPDVPVFRLDNDTTKTKNAHGKILHDFSQTKPAILVGTQMIAKGHDFADVTLVGILDADLSLYFHDFRATEKTFQLVTQVAGRAGRSEKQGHVVLQTFYPKHYVYRFAANYDYLHFYQKEDNLREITHFPPYSKIVRMLFVGDDEDKVKLAAHNTFLKLKEYRASHTAAFFFLEGMKSPVGRINNKYRYQIVMRLALSQQKESLDAIYDIEEKNRVKDVTCFIEQNAQNLS